MDNIIEPTIDYDFSRLYLGPPTTLSGGAYFTRIMYNTNKPIYIQTPKSLTKQGFIKSGKKIYTDLMFDNNDTVFINWVENLETKCQELIFNKGQSWFENKLEKDDIETSFSSPFKIFKSGKYYLLRVNVKQNIKIYDENDQIINIEDIGVDKTIISILEIQGIKFTSRNFQIEIELKQAMIVSPDPFLDECFIKKPIRKQNANEKEVANEISSTSEISSASELISASEITSFIKNTAKDLVTNSKPAADLEKPKSQTFSPINLEDSSFNKKEVIEESNQTNFVLDIEDFEPVPEVEEVEEKDDPNILKEFDLSSTLENNLESITLKKPNQVYYEIYQKARDKAKEAKKNAIVAYLEMKNIKKTYMLEDIDDSDSEFDDLVSKDSGSEVSDTESLED
jgi:rRNA-processing protein FCF1